MRRSLVRTVAWSAALGASVAALCAALGTSLLANYLLQHAEDRRLEEAATTFATELDAAPPTSEAILDVFRDESNELEHTGIVFAVSAPNGTQLAGPPGLFPPTSGNCTTQRTSQLRTCIVSTRNGYVALAGAAHNPLGAWLLGAAILAAALAALVAWLLSRPLSKRVIAPLSDLRARIEGLDTDSISYVDLGPETNVTEVDALRKTTQQLVARVDLALAQAKRFAANAAHELRTPLAIMRGELELLRESENADDPHPTENVHAKLIELSTLVDKLLILSLPRQHSTHEGAEKLALLDVLEDQLAQLPSESRARIKLDTGDALLYGDATLLGVLVQNALNNALKFGEHVEIHGTRTTNTVVLAFEDDGPGLAEHEGEHVFEPFHRGEHALRARKPGHGLGLALIRHIAETHGGSARFAEKKQRGARLEIVLPLA